MPGPRDIDLDASRARLGACLADWLAARRPGAHDLRVEGLAGPGTTGFSSDTLMFDCLGVEGGECFREPLVLRLEPTGQPVFPIYDVARQYRVQERLAATPVPVAPLRGFEPDPALLGARFYVMERVEGRIPSDNPPYHAGGWLTEVPAAERAALWWSGLEALAQIHRLDWQSLGLGFLERPGSADTALARELDDYDRFLHWATDGEPHPTCEAALDWLREHQPRDERTTLVWGDARIGNMVFLEGRCRAVLDWELASLSSPEADLGWWLFLDRHHSEGVGAARLPGFPSRTETIERYEALTGHRVHHLDYYERFAAFRFAVIMTRLGRQMKRGGVLPAEARFEFANPCSHLLARLLDLPAPT